MIIWSNQWHIFRRRCFQSNAIMKSMIKNYSQLFAVSSNDVLTPRNDSVRSGFCHLETQSMPVWFFAGSVPVRFGLIWVITDLEPAKRVHTKTLRCIVNIYIYIYMHALYAACARDEKNFLFAENIELDRSFQKLLEFCKSDENWAQLQALKLRQMLKLFATQ